MGGGSAPMAMSKNSMPVGQSPLGTSKCGGCGGADGGFGKGYGKGGATQAAMSKVQAMGGAMGDAQPTSKTSGAGPSSKASAVGMSKMSSVPIGDMGKGGGKKGGYDPNSPFVGGWTSQYW